MEPYGVAVPFDDLTEVLKINYTPEVGAGIGDQALRSPSARPSLAVIGAVSDARDRLSVIRLAPDRQDVRALIGAMMTVRRQAETSSFFVDAAWCWNCASPMSVIRSRCRLSQPRRRSSVDPALAPSIAEF